MRPEPVVLLALVEQHLQRPDTQRQQSDANVIELDPGAAETFQIGRIFDEGIDQKQCCHTDREIDEKNPPPGIVEGDPPAQGWPDRGRRDGGDSVERECQASLLRRKVSAKMAWAIGCNPPPPAPCSTRKKKKKTQTRRDPAKQRAQR